MSIIDRIEKSRIVATYGGMGSTFLVKKVENRVAKRFDNFFTPSFPNFPKGELITKSGIRLDEKGRDSYLDEGRYKSFNSRTPKGMETINVDSSLTLGENLKSFFTSNYRCHDEKMWIVSINSAMLNIFSHYEIKDVIFFIRHPLHSMGSYCKPGRHKTVVELIDKNTVNSKKIVKWWARDIWNPIAREYLRCKEKGLDPILIRYEYAKGDSEAHNVFWKGLKHGNRNHASDEISKYMLENTKYCYFKLYDSWEV